MENPSLRETISTRKTALSRQPQVAGRDSEDVIREWIARLATNCGQQLSEARVLLWIDELSHIEPRRLELAFRAVIRTHTFSNIPPLGEILAVIDQANDSGFSIEAEDAWRRALTFAARYFHPDLGIDRRAPQLPAEMDYAIRTAGGLRRLSGCSESELVWRKKEFLEAYALVRDARQNKHFLPQGKAKEILARLEAEARKVTAKNNAGNLRATGDLCTGLTDPEGRNRPTPKRCRPLRPGL